MAHIISIRSRGISLGATEAENEAAFYNLEARLRQSNQAIIALENLMRQNSAVAQAASGDILAARRKQNELAAQYIEVARAVTGNVPSGLNALPALAVWAGVIAGVAAGVVLLYQMIGVAQTKANAALQAGQNQGVLLNAAQQKDAEAQAAFARGDLQTAVRLAEEAKALRGQAAGTGKQSLTEWLQENWGYVAAAVGAIVIAPAVLR